MTELLWNPRRAPGKPFPDAAPTRTPLAFHRRLPGYRPSRLEPLDELASELGLERLWIKDESCRLGLPAFKILGVSWAGYRALVERLGSEPAWETIADLRDAVAPLRPLALVTATAGNHGRALARLARWLGLDACIFVPRGAPRDRVRAIADEGAHVVEADGGYDVAVEQASAWAADQPPERAMLISDTAASADEQVPAWISDGYSTIFWEVEDQLAQAGEAPPDAVLVQIGVGSLAYAAARHYRREAPHPQPLLVGVETTSAACLLESARADAVRAMPGPHESLMFCLNAGVPSAVSVTGILAGFDAFAAVGDELVRSSAQALARAGVVAGPTGTAGLVGLREILPLLGDVTCRRVLLINTEGAADVAGYAQALQTPAGVGV